LELTDGYGNEKRTDYQTPKHNRSDVSDTIQTEIYGEE
jgi:hypothetical protein